MILIVPVTGNHTLLNTLLFFTLYYLASYLQKTITGDRGSLTSTDGAGGLEKDTVNLVASFETALVVMPEKERGVLDFRIPPHLLAYELNVLFSMSRSLREEGNMQISEGVF